MVLTLTVRVIIKVKVILGEIKMSVLSSVILSKCQSNLSITNKVIKIFAKFNNLTLNVKVIQRSRSNNVWGPKRSCPKSCFV